MSAVAPLGHASDEALLALPSDETRRAGRTWRHVRSCALCRERLAELRRVPLLLRETATAEREPSRDLAYGAVRRLQRRQTRVTHVNEFFGVLFAIVRGLSTLFSSEDAPGERHASREGDRRG